jgi:TldD protein
MLRSCVYCATICVAEQRQPAKLVRIRGAMIEPQSSTFPSTDWLALAHDELLVPASMDFESLDRAIAAGMTHTLDYVDLYLQFVCHETWIVDDGLVKEGVCGLDRGLGVHTTSGERTGFAYSHRFDERALRAAVEAARSIAKFGGEGRVEVATGASHHSLYSSLHPLRSMTDDEKVAVLRDLDSRARALDARVTQVIANLAATYEIVLVRGSDGTLAADARPMVRLNVTVIMEKGGQREQGYAGCGGRGDFRQVMANDRPLELAREAVRAAAVNMDAVASPAGNMPVVLGAGWPGILLHEAIGHGLEGDSCRKGTSAFASRIGTRVAREECTVVDDGTLRGRRGSLNIDDEGTPTRCNTLIERGVLKGCLCDKLNARLMKAEPTGNGRRQSFAHPPIPRMTNTFMLPGKYHPEEIIASVDKGIYAPSFGGGQVDVTSGNFAFSASEAYLIERGKATTPVKGAMLTGNGPDILMRVSMVGNDLRLDSGVGTCRKNGQSVPVGVGQPTILVESLNVGGTRL